MTINRAIEILDPKNRDRYKSIYEFDQACRMGVAALKAYAVRHPEKNQEVVDNGDVTWKFS